MRPEDLSRLVTALGEPMRIFVRESRVRIALLINGSGQVIGQHGFARSYEVMNVASLAAAIHAAARALAELVDAPRWEHLHHAGRDRQIFMAPLGSPEDELIVVAIFDRDSSLGLVQFYYQKLERAVNALPEFRATRADSTQAEFELNLDAGLRFAARKR